MTGRDPSTEIWERIQLEGGWGYDANGKAVVRLDPVVVSPPRQPRFVLPTAKPGANLGGIAGHHQEAFGFAQAIAREWGCRVLLKLDACRRTYDGRYLCWSVIAR